MTRVFISYAIGNSDNVVKLSDALLRLEHVEVFVPSCSTYDGTNTSYKIKEALDDSITLIIAGILPIFVQNILHMMSLSEATIFWLQKMQ